MQLGYEVFHRDVASLVDFYVGVLGFDAPRDVAADHVVVVREGVRVGCTAMPGASSEERRPPHGCEIVLRVADVEAEYERVASSGWPIADALQTRPWGMTDFRVFDPSGLYIRVTNLG